MTNGHIREEDLELYALGALPEEEKAAVKAHAPGCSECARKLAEAQGRVAMLVFAVPQEQPAAAAKERLFARIAAETRIEESGERVADERRVVSGEIRRAIPWWSWALAPASLALAAACLLLFWQNRQLGSQLNVARQAAARMEKEKEHIEGLARVLASPDTVTVKLAGTSDAANAAGYVKYNARSGTVLYSTEHLPTLPNEKVYQMWLVPTTGAPISAGIFRPEDSTGQLLTAQVPTETKSKAFAVTIEPTGGVLQPTGPKVLLGAS